MTKMFPEFLDLKGPFMKKLNKENKGVRELVPVVGFTPGQTKKTEKTLPEAFVTPSKQFQWRLECCCPAAEKLYNSGISFHGSVMEWTSTSDSQR